MHSVKLKHGDIIPNPGAQFGQWSFKGWGRYSGQDSIGGQCTGDNTFYGTWCANTNTMTSSLTGKSGTGVQGSIPLGDTPGTTGTADAFGDCSCSKTGTVSVSIGSGGASASTNGSFSFNAGVVGNSVSYSFIKHVDEEVSVSFGLTIWYL